MFLDFLVLYVVNLVAHVCYLCPIACAPLFIYYMYICLYTFKAVFPGIKLDHSLFSFSDVVYVEQCDKCHGWSPIFSVVLLLLLIVLPSNGDAICHLHLLRLRNKISQVVLSLPNLNFMHGRSQT